MKTLQRCDANHANRCHSARCGVTTFFYSAALRCALSRCSSLMSLPVRMITFHPREYLVRRCSNPRRFNLIRQMQQEGKIRFTQLIWGGAKGAPLATTEDLSSQRSVACDSDGRWIHISHVPSDLRCQVIGE